MKNEDRTTLTIFILIPLAVGSLSALFSGNMSIYSTLNRPALSPPAVLFPIIWTLLYILMGISSYLIYRSNSASKTDTLTVYAIQLFFNFCWSIVFFRFSWYLFSFFWLLALIALIVLMIYRFFLISKTAAYLQIPYLLWCIFAAYLNFMIYLIN